MLECSRICSAETKGLRATVACAALTITACVTQGPEPPQAPVVDSVAIKAPTAPAVDPRALAEEARAHVAQAETDIQRARARRALWARAWESLVGARSALAANDHQGAILLAGRASELAQLGLEQLAYPAVKQHTTRSPS